MKHIQKSILLLPVLILLIVCNAAAQLDISKIEIKATQLSGTLYLLQGMQDGSTVGGNIVASIGPDGILLVDSQYAPLAAKVRDALHKITGSEPKIRFVINTHWHKDHTEGNKEFGREATIIAQKNVRELLSTGQTLLGRPIAAYPPEALPMVTFDDSMSLFFNGEEVRIVHLPNGHTSGDSIVFFTRSNVIHTGDIYTGPVFPFVDLDHGGNIVSLEKNVRTILGLISADTKVVPGHRLITDPAGLKIYDRMLSESLAKVRQGIAQGKDLKQIQDQGLSTEWTTWEWQALKTPQWIEYVYRSLAAK